MECLQHDFIQLCKAEGNGTGLFHNGSSLKGMRLVADILSGLDWMYANKYNETKSETGNWWDWEIGVPMNLTDAMVLIYDQMSAAQKQTTRRLWTNSFRIQPIAQILPHSGRLVRIGLIKR